MTIEQPTQIEVRGGNVNNLKIFNVVRLIFSRLGATRCPNGHVIQPSLKIAQAMDLAGDKMGGYYVSYLPSAVYG